MEGSHTLSDSDIHITDIDIPPVWIRGVHVDGTQAKKQAVEIDNNANMYLFPKLMFKLQSDRTYRSIRIETKAGDISNCEPHKLPLPGTCEFKVAAKAAVTKGITKAPEELQWCELRIPRKHIIFPPAALRPTKEFEEATRYALQLRTDNEKFIELQHVFREFGYYYPYWITTGGDPDLLRDNPDIDGWLESTTTRQVLVMPFDVNPIYDILGHEVSSEVQRIYRIQYSQPTPLVDTLIEADNSKTNALIRMSQTCGKVGVTKGVHFGGLLSEEDAVELVNETDITKLMRSVSVAGNPRIECIVRRTILGTSVSTHAFLPNDFQDKTAEDSGFMKAAVDYHTKSNSGELQPSTREMRYFVMYVTYREFVFDSKYIKGTDKLKQAVIKALAMKSNEEKYQELQKVFGSFGYYYPSSISLGGRLAYKAFPNDPSGAWLSKNGIENIDRLIMRGNPDSHYKEDIKIETIGGSSTVTGCQDWIESIRINQTRTQFGPLKPIYELLEDEQRAQVLQLYNWNHSHVDSVPEIPKGLHFDGTEAEYHAFEITKDRNHSKTMMLRNFSVQPKVEHVKRYSKDFKHIENYLSLDIETTRELPGDVGFVSGSDGAYKERGIAIEHHCSKTETTQDIAYVTCKELQLYDDFIQPTSQFKESIKSALLVGREDHNTYCALQDVFQRFGYYYPSSVQIGGRVVFKVPSQNPEDQSPTQGKTFENAYKQSLETGTDHGPEIVEITQAEPDNQEYLGSESSGAVVKNDQRLSKEIKINAIENLLTKSERWNSIGGDSVLLLLNNVKGWINTVELNQTITQHKGLRPIYELLDEEQRHKIRKTYESIILKDGRVRYGYPLELTNYEHILENERESASETPHIPTETLYEKLLGQVFSDNSMAILFCRSACADYGFSIIEEEATDQITYIYCSHSTIHDEQDEENKDDFDRSIVEDEEGEKKNESFCQWGVILAKNNEAQWQFQKLANNDESVHNHTLAIQETGTSRASRVKKKGKCIIRLVAERPVYAQSATGPQYVRYGDIVRVQKFFLEDEWRFISASEASDHSLVDEHLKNELKSSEFDSLWFETLIRATIYLSKYRKIVPCPLTSNEDEDEDKGQSNAIHDKEQTTDSYDYVRTNDIIIFESQVTLSGTIRVQMHLEYRHSISIVCTEAYYKSCRLRIRQMSQYIFQRNQDILNSKERIEQDELEIAKKHKNHGPCQWIIGKAYMSGLCGFAIDNTQALKHLQLAANQDCGDGIYELGNLYWKVEEYQKALDTYEKAALLSVRDVYCKLGDLYHTGFFIPQQTNVYAIPQDYKMAFMHYSIGGIFGDATAALKVGEYYEKGLIEEFGIDHNKALRWCEYVSNKLDIPKATSAVGRIKHTMANAAKDPSEADSLRREAYNAFEKVVMVEPYAKFMVAVYNLNGWGCQQPDPVLGFNILLSLVETGFDKVLDGIAKCYEYGVGVERDPAKASAYHELAVQMGAQ
ncbi:hypothetical protein DFQ30_000633 [Apophysomyces sp. BC1015]|nr:hypothetical protein DFQ30_000633 [Apophysomyces sp. BC1015]